MVKSVKIKDFLEALQKAYRRAGTQSSLAKQAGISQGRVADYLNNRCSVENMTPATLLKIFPNLKIDFFGEAAENPPESQILEHELLEIFRDLPYPDKVRCLTGIAMKYGGSVEKK